MDMAYVRVYILTFPIHRKRLLALAAQKFVADIATDAFQYCKVRQSGNRKTGKVSIMATRIKEKDHSCILILVDRIARQCLQWTIFQLLWVNTE